MTVSSSTRSAAVLILFVVGWGVLPPSGPAQDRSVPQFGPLVEPDTVKAGPFDLGRSWSVAAPPLDYLEETYEIAANERGLRHAYQATVRLPGCSGAVVSSQGLILTAARCVRSRLPADGDDLRETSMYAEEQAEERTLPDLYVERLIDVQDVTARVKTVATDGESSDTTTVPGARAVQQVEEQLTTEGEADTVEVVRERGGGRYVAYKYRRYPDVRLVFLADPQVRWGQHVDDQLTYPQYAWDVVALRVYEDGTPVQTETHFELRSQGGRPGDAVFAMGYPEANRRAETHQQLELARDLEHPVRLSRLQEWTDHLGRYVDTASAAQPVWTDRLHGARRSLKHTQAELESLENDYLMRRLQRRDQVIQHGATSDSSTAATASRAAELIQELAEIQGQKREQAETYRAFTDLLRPTYSSATLQRAGLLKRMEEQEETSSDVLDALESVSDQPLALDAALLSDALERIRGHFGEESTVGAEVRSVGPADSLVRASPLSSSAEARSAVQEGDVQGEDPVLALVDAVWAEYTTFRETWTTLSSREGRLTDSLSAVRQKHTDPSVALPQSRSFRFADGRIQGYPYNGTIAPRFTTFYGLYGHFQSRGSELPSAWRNPASTFDRSTPLTTISSTDFGDGGYGGPLVNSSLQLVGIVVDGNIQRAAADFLFVPGGMRTVSLDIRGIVEGLSSVYEAESLVQEIKGQSLSSQ